MKSLQLVAGLSVAALLAGCVAEAPRAPAPAPVQPAAPPPPVPSAPPPQWEDLPVTPGSWSYMNQGSVSEARFTAAVPTRSFAVRCDLQNRQISLVPTAPTGAAAMSIRTSSGVRAFALAGQGGAAVVPTDSFLDGIAFSRGHFSVEVAGGEMLVLPAWPEPARVIEDCRGGV